MMGNVHRRATVVTGAPTVACIADMVFDPDGLDALVGWVRSRAPECVPDGYGRDKLGALLPHGATEDGRVLSHNELLVELAGRKCYNSFGDKAGRKTNREYIVNTQQGDVPHASIMYHAKMTFFIGGVSRRVSHELIRHYVGADRTEEGSPSQESTRYVEHAGFYIAHPAILEDIEELHLFKGAMSRNYDEYLSFIDRREEAYAAAHGGEMPKGMDRKRIFESASPYLSHACETSFLWTTNPIALLKMGRERDHDAADLEFRRLMQVWKTVCVERWPNLFPESWASP